MVTTPDSDSGLGPPYRPGDWRPEVPAESDSGLGCYLCAPENAPADQDARDAWNEPCSKCDAEFWANPVYIDYGEGGHP